MSRQFSKLEFRRYGAPRLLEFANQVYSGIYENTAVFASPVVPREEYEVVMQKFEKAYANYKSLGFTRKQDFLDARNKLLNYLDSLAEYVDSVAKGNASTIALSGFEPSKETYQRATPLDKIENFVFKRTSVSGQIIVDIPVISNKGTVNYACICSEGEPLSNPMLFNGQLMVAPGDPAVRQDFNKSRRKVFNGLTPGVVYYFYVFATNTVSVSPLSDAKSVMAA